MKLHETRQVAKPIDAVFAYAADFANSAEWDPGVSSAVRVGDRPPGVGTEYQVMVTFGSNEIPMTYTTLAHEHNSRVVLEGRGENLTARDEITFTERDGGTLVDYTAYLEFTNWIRWVSPLMKPLMNRVGEKALDGLVKVLER